MTTQTSGISQSLPRVSYVKVSGQQQSQVYISNAYAYDPNSFTTANGGRFTQSARTTFRDKKTSCDIEPIYITHAVRDKASVANVSSVCDSLVDRVTLSQGHPVGSVCDRLIDRVSLWSEYVTVLLTRPPCHQCVWPSYWQGHPVGSICDRLIDRVTLSAVYVTVFYWQGQPVTRVCDRLIDRSTLSSVNVTVLSTVYVTVLMTGPAYHQSMWPSYWQGQPVIRVCDRLIDMVSLSSEYATVLLTGSPCHQCMWPSYWQGQHIIRVCDRLIDRATLS